MVSLVLCNKLMPSDPSDAPTAEAVQEAMTCTLRPLAGQGSAAPWKSASLFRLPPYFLRPAGATFSPTFSRRVSEMMIRCADNFLSQICQSGGKASDRTPWAGK